MRRGATMSARVAVSLLLLQAFLIVIDGLARWWFATPIHGLEDVNGLLIAIIVASFFPAILIERQNIRVTILGRMVKKKYSAWLDVFGHFILLVFIVIIAWQFAAYAIDSRGQTTLILRAPVAPAMFASAIVLAACAPIQAFVLFTEIWNATRPNAKIEI